MVDIDDLEDDLVVVSSEYPLFFISKLKVEENKKKSMRNKQMIVHSMKLTMEKRVRVSTQLNGCCLEMRIGSVDQYRLQDL